ncbi:MAG: ABC transporter ATP-binding protein [Clostridia bacterium]|nr:ABC transporter ATP-binding protein [Clostridia bacterium]
MEQNIVNVDNDAEIQKNDEVSEMSEEYVLETKNLTKTYSRKNVVNNLNMKIRKGDIYGFIGKNGAGKTTTIKMISGMISPSSGSIKLFGKENLSEPRKKIGCIIENPAFYPYMSAHDNIEAQRILKGVKDKSVTNELLEIVGLGNAGKKKLKNFSLGMKQRLAIALALVGDPEILLLDEPINGLDPSGIKEIRELVLKLSREAGITVLISSHILSELTKISSAYGVIKDGNLIAQFTKEELAQRVRPSLKVKVNDLEKSIKVLKEKFSEIELDVIDDEILIYNMTEDFRAITNVLEEFEIIIQSLSKSEGDYENYFINLMEGEIKDE